MHDPDSEPCAASIVTPLSLAGSCVTLTLPTVMSTSLRLLLEDEVSLITVDSHIRSFQERRDDDFSDIFNDNGV